MMQLASDLRIGARIGAGYYGEVHIGTDDVHSEVAIKILRPLDGESPLERLCRKRGLLAEARSLSQATHQNVVRVFYVVEAGSDEADAVHLVMEYCEGGSVQSSFERGPIKIGEVRRIITGAALGLQALHARGMLHRDIKPSNLLMDANRVVKLGDFGFVTDNLILGYGSQAGYYDHIPPEVRNGSGTSVKSDIWALGMTTYRLLHGSEWYGRSPKPMTIIPDGGFAGTLKWLPHVPQKWRRFVRKALNDDPDSRFPSATAVMAGLAKLEDEPGWDCSVTASKTCWQRKTKSRQINVVWTKHSPRQYTWEAWSEPLVTGRCRSLGGSTTILGYAESERQLSEFFSQRLTP
jgi:serine/threonine protein kinase